MAQTLLIKGIIQALQGMRMIKYILVIVDEPQFVNGLVNGLGTVAGNVNVFAAGNVRKAVEILRTISVDLVVMDREMSVVDGFPLAEYIKREHPGAAVRVMSVQDKAVVKNQLDAPGVQAPEASVGSLAIMNGTMTDDRDSIQRLSI
jgi:CheY-like chemotaxis protein